MPFFLLLLPRLRAIARRGRLLRCIGTSRPLIQPRCASVCRPVSLDLTGISPALAGAPGGASASFRGAGDMLEILSLVFLFCVSFGLLFGFIWLLLVPVFAIWNTFSSRDEN